MSEPNSNRSKRWLIDIALIALASFILIVPVLIYGIPTGNDLPEHYRFALAFEENLAHGIFYPSRSDSVNGGLGDVGVRFYPPLTYYVLNLARSVTGSWFYGSILAFFIFFALGGIGAYLWARESFGETASLIGALVYVLLPYHVNQLFNAFLLAEFAAAAVMPFCFLFASRSLRLGEVKNVLLFALAFTAVLLTHIPTSMIVLISLVVYAAAFLWRSRTLGGIARLAAGIGTALMLSSFYLVRLITERDYLKHASAEFASLDFDFRANFLLSYFYASGSEYMDRSLWFGDVMLVLTLLASVPLLVIFWKRANEESRSSLFPLVPVMAIALFFATPVSSLLWTGLPLLAKIQFPFRWMSVITLCASLFIAAGFARMAEMFKGDARPRGMLLAGGILIAVAFSAFQVIRPARYSTHAEFTSSVERYRTSESCECWWPIWAERAALGNLADTTGNGRQVLLVSRSPNSREFTIADGEPTDLRVATFFYPHWNATVNETSIEVNAGDDGAIVVPLPSGEVGVLLEFVEPWFNRMLGWISAVAFGLVIIFLLFLQRPAIRPSGAE